MERMVLQIEFITPCFLAGASGQIAEWRAASVRGQIRWWLRAVAGGAEAGNQKTVAEMEEEIFGTSSKQGVLQLAVTAPHGGAPESFSSRKFASEIAAAWKQANDAETVRRLTISNRDTGREIPSNPLAYLGYGALDFRGVSQRDSIPAGAKASLRLQSLRPLADDALRYLQDAIWCWFNLGGIGAKCRKGFGSLCALDEETVSAGLPKEIGCKAIADFEPKARRILASYCNPLSEPPEWSHFSEQASVWVAPEGAASWEQALEQVGCWLIAFRRRYGNPADYRILGGTNIADRDYSWAAPKARKVRQKAVPDRAGFGLPLPFGPGGETVVRRQKDDRRASPLLIHISRFGVGAEAKYHPVFTHLPARLIPAGDRLTFKAPHSAAFKVNDRHERIIVDFLEDLAGKNLLRKVQRDA